MEAENSVSLPNQTVVVRGAKTIDRRLIRSAAKKCRIQHGRHGISVFAFPEMDAAGIVAEVRERTNGAWLPHKFVLETTAEKLDANDFALELTNDEGHYLLMLPEPITDKDFERLEKVFEGEPVSTPNKSE